MNRKIITSLLVIGVVGTVAGGSTFALFNDTETSSTNTFAAGGLDIKVDYEESYNGEFQDSSNLTDNPGAIFNLDDVKPGDYGEATISIHNQYNPAYVSMNLTEASSQDNTCTEPERKAEGGSCGTEGELAENLYMTIWHDDGDNVLDDDEEVIEENITAAELDSQEVDLGKFERNETQYIGVKWNVPRDVGNEIQTDSSEFDIAFQAIQARHNDQGDTAEDEETAQPEEQEENVTEDEENKTVDEEENVAENDTEMDNNYTEDEKPANETEDTTDCNKTHNETENNATDEDEKAKDNQSGAEAEAESEARSSAGVGFHDSENSETNTFGANASASSSADAEADNDSAEASASSSASASTSN